MMYFLYGIKTWFYVNKYGICGNFYAEYQTIIPVSVRLFLKEILGIGSYDSDLLWILGIQPKADLLLQKPKY